MRDWRNRRGRCGSMSCGHSMEPRTQIRRATRSCMPSDPNYIVRRHAEEMRRLTRALRICVDLNGNALTMLFLVAQRLKHEAALVGRPERLGRRCELDHLVQLLPRGSGATGGQRMHLRRRIMFDQKHAE